MARKINWTPAALALLGKLSDQQLAKMLGCDRQSVLQRRKKLGIPAFIPSPMLGNWGITELGMLGRIPDADFAAITGRSLSEIAAKRKELGR